MATPPFVPLWDVDTGRVGLPRPVATAPDDKLRPVPWSQSNDEWGQVDDPRLGRVHSDGLCLVCGEFVDEGVVVWDRNQYDEPGLDRPPPQMCDFYDLGFDVPADTLVSDGGALHHRCAKMTRAHCRHVRERIHAGKVSLVPYHGPICWGLS